MGKAQVKSVLQLLQALPNARQGADLDGLARAMDSLFWSLPAQAVGMPKQELNRWIESCTHLIYHALFAEFPVERRPRRPS
jgi:hypothetical protein